MRKGNNGEKKTGGKKMMKIVATKDVASRPPERQPTATPTARANICAELRMHMFTQPVKVNAC